LLVPILKIQKNKNLDDSLDFKSFRVGCNICCQRC
jgi:hypothetical protein